MIVVSAERLSMLERLVSERLGSSDRLSRSEKLDHSEATLGLVNIRRGILLLSISDLSTSSNGRLALVLWLFGQD